jgi:hypothetical protein
MKRLTTIFLAIASITLIPPAAQSQTLPHLHINDRWHECSFQIDPSLTQAAWRQFSREAGLVVYFRPLSDARPMGKGNFEISAVQWETRIDDADAAWNDTFVHPDSTHYLFEGDGLKFPGLMIRSGVTEKTDVGLYVTKNPNANYGFFGGQVQRALVSNARWGAAARASFVSMYGPEDLDFSVYGVDLAGSRTFTLNRWASVSPYVGISHYLSRAHEKTTAVSLKDEVVAGSQGSFGTALNVSAVRLAAEYNVAQVRSLSLKMGVGF